jgi:hypothetical protein
MGRRSGKGRRRGNWPQRHGDAKEDKEEEWEEEVEEEEEGEVGAG